LSKYKFVKFEEGVCTTESTLFFYGNCFIR